MVVELITLPLRISVRAANLMLRGAGEVADRAYSFVAGGSDPEWRSEQPQQRTTTSPEAEQQPTRPTVRAEAPARQDAPPVAEDMPVHVSEEPTLVEQRADRDAEEGAGAEVTSGGRSTTQ